MISISGWQFIAIDESTCQLGSKHTQWMLNNRNAIWRNPFPTY